jgi:hypothetical protein
LSTCTLVLHHAVSFSFFVTLQPLRSSFLIETSGPITVDFNCFYNNTVGVANVGSYVADLDFTQNFGEASSGQICEFLAAFETSVQFELFTPTCVSWDDPRNAASCSDSLTKTPTIPPTDYPSTSPSAEPTTVPTSQPSNRPSPGETSVPTLSPYPTSSMMPSMITSAPTTAAPTNVETTPPTSNQTADSGSGISSLCTLISASAAAVLSLWML